VSCTTDNARGTTHNLGGGNLEKNLLWGRYGYSLKLDIIITIASITKSSIVIGSLRTCKNLWYKSLSFKMIMEVKNKTNYLKYCNAQGHTSND